MIEWIVITFAVMFIIYLVLDVFLIHRDVSLSDFIVSVIKFIKRRRDSWLDWCYFIGNTFYCLLDRYLFGIEGEKA